MDKARIIGTVLMAVFVMTAVTADLGSGQRIPEEKETFKKRWLPTIRLRRIRERMQRWIRRPPIYYRIRSWVIRTIYAPMIASVDGLAVKSSKWAGADPTCGCWHTSDSGATKEAYSDAVYSEAWGSDTTKSFDVTYKQAIVTNITPSSTAGSIILNRSSTAKFTMTFEGGDLKYNGGSADGSYTPDTEITLQLIPDFINSQVHVYIDGSFESIQDFDTGEVCNQFDEIERSGTFTAVGNIEVADSFDNIRVHFSDTLNEDTLSDYTLGGDTNPTYDSTEKAIKLYDDTDADNKVSIADIDIDSPQDNIIIKYKFKLGSNDTSTNLPFRLALRSKSDVDTYIGIRHYTNSNAIYFDSYVDGTFEGDNGSYTFTADTWYKLKVVMNLTGTSYLFIDDVEQLSFTTTSLKRFFDGNIYMATKHDAGEVSEVYVKDILVEDAPTVNAPRSNPPGLLTSGIRPAVEETEHEDLAGAWEASEGNSTSVSVENDGVYGKNILYTADTSAIGYMNVSFVFDNPANLSKFYGMKVNLEIDNMTDYDTVALYDGFTVYDGSNIDRYDHTMTVTDKKHEFIFYFSSPDTDGGVDYNSVTRFRLGFNYDSVQTVNFKISDIQFLGGPEHHIMGQPLYKSPWADGIDDTPEATLGGDTAPAFDTDRIDFDETTNADNQTSEWSRSLNFNPNGVGYLKWEAEILATDSATGAYWNVWLNIDSSNYLRVFWEDNSGTPRIRTFLRSGGTHNFSCDINMAKDNNSNIFEIFFHKDYGFVLLMNGELMASDFTLNGTWSDWTNDVDFEFLTQHDAGEESHVKFHSIEFNRHPLNVHRFQSNELETLTDTLAPSGTDYMDGDWDGSASVEATGNPVTNGKYVKLSSVADGSSFDYDLDSGADLRRMDRTRLWIKGSNAGNHNIKLQTSSGNDRLSANYDLTADTWTLVDIEDIIDASWGSSGSGTLDPSDITVIGVENNSGGASDISIYGFQFLSSEYDTEDFIPQTLDIEWDAGSTEYGTFYMGPNEKARIHKILFDGHVWIDQADLEILDVWGGGIGGSGTTRSHITLGSITDETGADNTWAFWTGSFSIPGGTNIDHINSEDGAAVYHGRYSNIDDWAGSEIRGTAGVLMANNANTVHIKAVGSGDGGSDTSEFPFHPTVAGSDWYLEEGLVNDDLGTLIGDIELATGTQWEWATDREISFQDFSINGTGYFSVYDGVALTTKAIKFNGSEVESNTTGAGYFIEALGGGASWTHTRRLKGIETLYGRSPFTNIRSWTNLDTWTNLLKWT